MAKALLLVSATLLMGCSPDKFESLSANIGKWEEHKPHSYSFVGRFECMSCKDSSPFLVKVVGDSYEVEYTESGNLYPRSEVEDHWLIGPVDHVFQGLLVVLREEPNSFGGAEYDPKYGYPQKVQLGVNTFHPLSLIISDFKTDDDA